MKKYLPWLALFYAVMIPLFGILWPRTIWRLIRGKDLISPEGVNRLAEARELLEERGWFQRRGPETTDDDVPAPEMTDEEAETWIREFRMDEPDPVAAAWLEESRKFLDTYVPGWARYKERKP